MRDTRGSWAPAGWVRAGRAGRSGSWAVCRGLRSDPCPPPPVSSLSPQLGLTARAGEREGRVHVPIRPTQTALRVCRPGPAGTYRTASPTAAVPAPGTGRRSPGSPSPQQPRPPPLGRLGLGGARSAVSLTPSPAPLSQWPAPHLGAGSDLGAPCHRRAAAPASRSRPWGLGAGGGTAGLGTPNWVGPPGTLVAGPQAAAGVGLGAGAGVGRLGGGGAPCRDSQLSEGADSHGCTLRSHM